MAYSSQEDVEDVSDPERLADQYGTPPVKHSLTQSRMDKLSGPKRVRKPIAQVEVAKKEKSARRNKNAMKFGRQKERMDARAFKELDTTLQVLGIDGTSESSTARVIVSPHAPLLQTPEETERPEPKRAAALEQRPSSKFSLESQVASYGDATARVRSLSLHEPRRSDSPLTLLSRVSSRADSLADERQRWHQGLDDLLQGNLDQDDLQVAVSLASGKANDLREQLIFWQTPPEASWQAREERIEWLNQAMAQLRDVTIGLQQHGIDIKDTSHVELYQSILKEVMVEMGNMTEMCCDAIIEGLQALKDSPQDLHRAYRSACSIIVQMLKPFESKKAMMKSGPCAGWTGYLDRSGGQCVKVLIAMMDATTDLQAELLQASSLTVSLGKDMCAHEVSDRCKQLQFAWQWCAEMTALVSKRLPAQAATVQCAWCSLMLEAATLATSMQHDLLDSEQQGTYPRATTSGLSDDSLAYGNTGVWCTAAKETSGAASDEELQAQAWLPACLTALLANAQNAASAALGAGCEEARPEGATEDWRACSGLVEALSDALYELAVAGNHRIGAMCVSPSGLACWALELLEEQACQAVVFVRDLDKSILGGGENGLTHYEALRHATDALINAIFRVRRLLKQKRAADPQDALPRPLPDIARTDSHSSLTAALQRKASEGRSPHFPRKASNAKTPKPGRPPLANGPSVASVEGGKESRMEDDASGRHPSANGSHSPADQAEHPARRPSLRHHHGSATPPILEDSDGEAGRSRPLEQTDANGLDHRDSRPRHHHSKRHRHRKHKHQRRTPVWDRTEGERRAASPPPSDGDGTAQPATPPSYDPSTEPHITDPFALPECQRREGAALVPSGSLPLAVFSSADGPASNSLVPVGSRSMFKFGDFSTSPSQGSGVPSPAEVSAAMKLNGGSPFAGFQPPPGKTQTVLEKEASEGSSHGPSTPVLHQRGALASVATRDLAGRPLQARRSSSNQTASDAPSQPQSDPTNGYHHMFAPLTRISAEPPRRKASSETSDESHDQDATEDGSSLPTPPEHDAVAFKLPWEGDPFWQISWESLKPTIVRKIGSGSFGQVFEVYYLHSPMAIKIINIDGDATALPGALMRFKQEVDLQKKLSLFPYIVRFLGACCHIPNAPPGSDSAYMTSNVTLAIVMELCRFGTLFKVIDWARKVAALPSAILDGTAPPVTQEERRLKASPGFRLYNSWQLRVELAKHAASAVEFMHANNVIHRDLTSYNLLVTEKFEAKVADFNLSRAMKGEMIPSSGVINSPEWAAPERLTNQRTYNGRAADVFSFGVILWELITLARPWYEPEVDLPSSAEDGGVPRTGVPEPDCVQQPPVPFFAVIGRVPYGERLKFPPCEDVRPPLPQLPELIELAEDCWRQDPAQRPTMTAVCARLDAILEGIRQDSRRRRRV